jgi:hypothetical protein
MNLGLSLLLAVGLVGCASSPHGSHPGGAGGSGGTGGSASDSLDTASAKFPDMQSLWSKSISRTCGPNNGVCHDNKQFPDLQTPTGLLEAVNVRCNQLRDDPTSIDNLCEPPGDAIQFGTFQTKIGFITPEPDATNPTTLQITLADPIPAGADPKSVSVVRQREGLDAVTMPIPAGAVGTLATGTNVLTLTLAAMAKTPGPTPTTMLADFLLPATPTAGADDQVELGDPNQDGVFGATLGGALIKPGKPLLSYLFLRISKPLTTGMDTNTKNAMVVEPQMPIANFQYWDAVNANLALWCWISGMKPDGSNADGPIDYAHCAPPPPIAPQTGEAVTYSAIYEQVLRPSCAALCHKTGTKQPTTLYLDDPATAYETMLGLHGTGPTESKLPFVTRSSYIYLKVSETTPPSGGQMPLSGPLPADQVALIKTWIAQGANDN